MPEKITRSAPRPSFGLPEPLLAIHTRVSLAARPQKREYSRQFGSHPGNPGLIATNELKGILILLLTFTAKTCPAGV